MSRHYDDPIEVRATASSGAPDAFLWQGRIHLVRSVLEHWVQRHSWWRGAWDDGDASPTSAAPGVATDTLSALEHDVWRVEATAGRDGVSGVYDLVHLADDWRLVRVLD